MVHQRTGRCRGRRGRPGRSSATTSPKALVALSHCCSTGGCGPGYMHQQPWVAAVEGDQVVQRSGSADGPPARPRPRALLGSPPERTGAGSVAGGDAVLGLAQVLGRLGGAPRAVRPPRWPRRRWPAPAASSAWSASWLSSLGLAGGQHGLVGGEPGRLRASSLAATAVALLGLLLLVVLGRCPGRRPAAAASSASSRSGRPGGLGPLPPPPPPGGRETPPRLVEGGVRRRCW